MYGDNCDVGSGNEEAGEDGEHVLDPHEGTTCADSVNSPS